MAKKLPAIPKTLGACADKLYALGESRKALMVQVAALEEQEKALKNHLIETLPKSDAQGVMGKRAKVSIVTKRVPTASDWDQFYRHVLKTKDFSLMQRRLSEPAIREHWEAGEKIPGVEPFNVVKCSITKL